MYWTVLLYCTMILNCCIIKLYWDVIFHCTIDANIQIFLQGIIGSLMTQNVGQGGSGSGKSPRWSAIQHEAHDSLLLQHAFVGLALPVGTLSLDGAAGERRGVGWGQQYIPEYMTRCSRFDRSQPWLMKPKHFHRCFYTLGSTSSPQTTLSPCPPSPRSALKSFHLLS